MDDAAFAGSIPALYEELLVPFMFEPYAADLVARLGRASAILETAAGTGVVTRAVATAHPSARVVATDMNAAMLEIAARRCQLDNVTWKQADAQKLSFADGEFDAVLCQFGVMFFPDKHAGYTEALRVLAPGGQFLFNVWDRVEENETTRVVSETIARLFPGDPPRFVERTPFGYFDPVRIRTELAAAGFDTIAIHTVDKVSRVSAEQAAVGLCQGAPLRSEIEARDARRLDEVTKAAVEALTLRLGPSFDNRMRALVISASR